MAHSYTNILIHYVFSTKNREKIITAPLQQRLWSYMGGIARDNNMKALAIGGIEDHVHLLISLPTTLSIAKAIQLIKGGSSKWVHDTFTNYHNFQWQVGYGAFSVSSSCTKGLITYINGQKDHHYKKSFQKEYVSLLEKNVIIYDGRYIWG
ncbi:MAG: IS200/IS605 family transposase [Spirochaetales bacterium]|nr:IS200/IS605 family transposase [Spirochaetales bacterium]